MRALWKSISGVRKMVLDTFFASAYVLITYLIAYWLSGKTEIAAFASAFAAVIAIAASAFAIAAFASAFVVAVIATAAFASAFAIAASAFAIAAVIAIASAFVVAEEYKIKHWKIWIVYIVEALVLFSAMKFAAPYLAIGVLIVLCIGIVFLLVESKRRLHFSTKNKK